MILCNRCDTVTTTTRLFRVIAVQRAPLNDMANKKKQPATPPLVVVLPGDNVTKQLPINGDTKPKLGPGLRFDSATKQVFATLAGRFVTVQLAKTAVCFVRQNFNHRYRPVLQDRVVGIIEERAGQDGNGGDLYRVNLASSHPGLLSSLAFEGATKRNRPSLQPGQAVYARVISTLADQQQHEPLSLSCQLGPHDVGVPRKDWMTNEGTYGELRGGNLCRVSIGLARELLHPDNLVLQELSAAKLAFEIAVGVNGFLWIHSQLPEYTIVIQNAILNSEVLSEEQVRSMVKSLVFTVEKQVQQDRDATEE